MTGYMQSWEEFGTKAVGSIEHMGRAINTVVMEARNGAATVFPQFVWVARAA